MPDIAEKMLLPNETYDVTLLSVDIKDHSAQSRYYTSAGKSADFTHFMNRYDDLIEESTTRAAGYAWSWEGDGGLRIFPDENCREAAAMAGMQIINTWPLLGIDPARNPSGIRLSLRVAASAGLMIFREPRSKVLADCINRAAHLQKGATDPNEFTIDQSVYCQLSERLQRAFRFKEIFDGMEVFRYIPQVPDRWPDDSEVEDLIERVKKHVDELLEYQVPKEAILVSSEVISKILHNSESVYSDIQQFSRWFKDPDEKWAEGYFRRLASSARQLTEVEGRLYQAIHDWLARLSAFAIRDSGLLALQMRIASCHGEHVEVGLANLEQRLEGFASEAARKYSAGAGQRAGAGQSPDAAMAETPGPSKKLIDLANRFVSADEMGVLASFAPLTTHPREELRALISGVGFSKRDALVTRLGSMPDLVLTEDLRRDIRPAGDAGLFAVLCSNRAVGKKFRVLANLLNSADFHPDAEEIGRLFRSNGLDLAAPELVGIQRAIIVAHSKPEIRQQAVSAVPLDELWQTVAYEGTPVLVLSVVAKRLGDWHDDHLKKIFFDCVKERLAASIHALKSPPEFWPAKELLELFLRFDCFVASSYFSPLAGMVAVFSRKTRDLGGSVKLKGWDEIVAKLHSGLFADDPEPPRVDLLPLSVQRYLARLGRFPLMFACSGNHLVAQEVAEHINGGNITRFLQEKELNRQLLAMLLNRHTLLSKQEPLLLALTHARCHPGYAEWHLNRLSKPQLDHVIACPTTNGDVRAKAREIKRLKYLSSRRRV